MMDYKLISADSHVNEPLSMWQERMPAEFRHKAPHRKVVDGKLLEIRDGMRPRRVELGTEEMDKDDLLRENAVEDGWDVKVRLEAQDTDGVAGEVIYPELRP